MILGHIPVPSIPLKLIYAFHMPLFFIISGWLYKVKADSKIKYLWKKAKALLIPYFFFALVGYILWFVELKPKSLQDMLKPIAAIFWDNTQNMPIAGALWFLTASLIVSVLFKTINNSDGYSYIVKCLVLMLVGFFVEVKTRIVLPWSCGIALIAIGFMALGYFSKDKLFKLPGWVVLLGSLCCLPIVLMNTLVSMRTASYGNILSFLISSSIWSLATIYMSFKLLERMPKCSIIRGMMCKIGRNSIVYLCLNEIVINISRAILTKAGLAGSLLKICIFIITMVILYFCEKVLTSEKLRVLIGK